MKGSPRTIGTAALWLRVSRKGGTGRLVGPSSEYELGFDSLASLRSEAGTLPQPAEGEVPDYTVLGNRFVLDACTAERAEAAVRGFVERKRTKALSFEIEDEVDRYTISSLSAKARAELAVEPVVDGRATGRMSIRGIGDYAVTFLTPVALVAAAEAGVEADGYAFFGNVFVLRELTPEGMRAAATHLVRTDQVTLLAPVDHEYGADIRAKGR
jgi:hypothetical protein